MLRYPKLVGAHETRGVGLQKPQRFAEAASYDRAIALAPYDASTIPQSGQCAPGAKAFNKGGSGL